MNLGVQGDKGNMKTNNNVMFFLFQRWNNKASKNWIVSFLLVNDMVLYVDK